MPLPTLHKALVQETHAAPLIVKTLPTPQPGPGSAVIKILYSPIISYMRDVYNGVRQYAYAVPLIPGVSAIGRVAAIGPDTTALKEGDLVYCDCTIRGRDDSDAIFLLGLSEGGTEGSRKLMDGEWRDGTFAEFAKLPLENVFRLDEGRLCGELGYAPEKLCFVLSAMVPYGGLRGIRLQPGETVIVAPATGGFGSAAVVVALAMGAGKVIAMGRNVGTLEKLKTLGSRVETVQMDGDVEAEMAALKKFGTIDAFFDISPKEAAESTHFKSAILSLSRGGRVSLMGGLLGDLPIPHRYIMRFDITLKGKWMYSREDNIAFLKLISSGAIDLNKIVNVVGKFKLDSWEEAFEVAWNNGRLGQLALFEP